MSIRKAISVIFKYEDEIFQIVRQNYLRAFPGYTAFPGGKVDKEDVQLLEEETLLVTLKREMNEELEIDLTELQKKGTVKSLRKIAKATSPKFNPHRFETFFYLVELTEKIEFNFDQSEFKSGCWMKATDLLDEFNRGTRLIVPPVRKMIELIALREPFEEPIDLDINRFSDIPVIEPIKDFIQAMPASNTLPPANRTNMFVLGGENKMLVDPSPKNKEEYEHLKKFLSKYTVDKIFITHHHSDHHQYAVDLASELKCSITISRDSFERIKAKFGADYFKKIKIDFAKEGDIVSTWLGENIRVIEIPGHDEGHLALAPESNKWCIVGDLFQGIGTVVVGDSEGDMTKYLASLQKIIDLNPLCVTPSHGITLGGTHILQKTLEHRIYREKQIKELLGKGYSIERILSTIYIDLPKQLEKYAIKNIKSHIKRIEELEI
jgi:glyoxylase-like metal-dependent hydrolase (beta-lactamase superfamily II)/8-oxo-dGTP pyrophosphatase MutT (NUDIX family)